MNIKELNEVLTKALDESLTNVEVLNAPKLGSYEVSYNVLESGKVILHKVEDKVAIEYRLGRISGCDPKTFETEKEALDHIEAEINGFKNVSNIEFKADK